ncbi:MAG: GFA family protein [Solirubrobacteraceae bacterium]
MSFPLTGGCACGAVRFEVGEPFISATYCHCTRCQRRTGTAASASARARSDSFRILEGEDRIRSWKPADGAEKFFCGDCGSALFSRNPADPAHIGVRLGALDADPEIRPGARQYVTYAAVWEQIPDDGLPRHPERTPPG